MTPELIAQSILLQIAEKIEAEIGERGINVPRLLHQCEQMLLLAKKELELADAKTEAAA